MKTTMNDINKNSPLFAIRRPLKLLRWILGYPLQATDATFSRFRFVTWMECARFTVLTLILLCDYQFWAIMFIIKDGNLDNLFEFYLTNYNKLSVSKIDKVLPLIFTSNIIFSSILYLLTFKWNANAISNLCQEISRQKSKLFAMLSNHNEERTTICSCPKMEYPTRTIMYGQLLNVLSSILWGLWIYLFLIYHLESATFVDYKHFVQVMYPILIVIQQLFMKFGPIHCSAEIVVGQIVDSISDLYCYWNKVMLCIDMKDQARRSTSNHENNGQNCMMNLETKER